MILLQLLTIYALGGVLFSIYAEIIMEGDSDWSFNQRLLVFLTWPLALYALTL